MTALLEARDVSVWFGGLKALEGVSFTIEPGEIVGLIGPNGAGKTTLLNAISGVVRLSRGSLWLRGQQLDRLPPHQRARLGIARTFQVVKPFHRLTVRENVAVGALFGGPEPRSMAEALARADEVLQQVGLEHFGSRNASDLTVTSRRTLELARALATGSQFVLLDEVMAGLTPVEVDRMIELIRSLNALGVTFLVVEHVMKAIMSISQRIIVLHHGQKIADGPPEAIIQDEQVIAAYLGERYVQSRRGSHA